MKVLLLGSGGREAALAWKMAQSPLVKQIVICPGNGGMVEISPKVSLLNVKESSVFLEHNFDLVVVGPEACLAEGIVDFFEQHKVLVVGPSLAASKLESSKEFCKEILNAGDIPTARHKTVTTLQDGLKVIENWPVEEMVIKVDALAQGKGVVVAGNKKEATEALTDFFSGKYLGYAVEKIVIEEMIQGHEASAFALCDGENFVYLGSATDYKRINDGDQGPNTGGMGTVSPAPFLTRKDEDWVKHHVFSPLMKVMKLRGHPFKGFLFAGLMKSPKGFSVLEFNVRLGDPETQSLLPRMQGDIVPLLIASAKGNLKSIDYVEAPSDLHALHVVMTAKGYPGVNGEPLQKGDLISVGKLSSDSLFFPAAVSRDEKGLFTNGGRICGITCVGKSLREVRAHTYGEVAKIHFAGAHYRKDIGEKFL
ncbi:MAG TPA: phosphoribosylamine--glycine ligase [Bacteriovoracaceae bacterium]|nr:phosphoribosylamine--glycine ligase [Bacteriovoracaceae bacterium]